MDHTELSMLICEKYGYWMQVNAWQGLRKKDSDEVRRDDTAEHFDLRLLRNHLAKKTSSSAESFTLAPWVASVFSNETSGGRMKWREGDKRRSDRGSEKIEDQMEEAPLGFNHSHLKWLTN